MLITKQNIDIWYRAYEKQREITKKYILSRKGKIPEIEKLSRAEFEDDFISIAQDNPTLGPTAIAKKMAKMGLYDMSYKQATKFAEAHAKHFGGTVNVNLVQKYRMNADLEQNLWDAIATRRSELHAAGNNTYKANLYIGNEFFGSEHIIK